MPIQSAALELLIALAPVASRWGRWYLFGAQAVILYGVPRLSADVDVTLALEPDTPDRFVVDMTAAGFSLRIDDPDFVRRTRVMPFIHTSTGMPVDVVLRSGINFRAPRPARLTILIARSRSSFVSFASAFHLRYSPADRATSVARS